MKRIMCYCLAISMIQHGSSEMDCTEPQLLVKETYCGYDNLTSLTMYTLNQEFDETLPHEGCGIDFIEPYLNNTFYIECEMAETNCYDDVLEVEKVKRAAYYLECYELDLFENYTTVTFGYNDTNASSTEMDTILNETTTTLAVVSTDATVNTTDADYFSNESSVTVSWSTLDVFANGSASSPEMDTFPNETTTDLAVVSTDATVDTTDAHDFSNESSVTNDSWLTLGVFVNGSVSSTEMDTFPNETTTDLAVVSTDATVNTADAHDFSNESSVTNDSWLTLGVFVNGSVSSTEMDTFPNETTTDLAVVSTDATVNTADAHDFSNESSVTNDSWLTLGVFVNGSVSSTEMDTFPNETKTDLAVVSTDATVDTTDAHDFSNESSVTNDSWLTLGVFVNRSVSSTEMDTFPNETTTDLAVVSTDATVNTTDAHDFSNESSVTDGSRLTLDVFANGSETPTEILLGNGTPILWKEVEEHSPDSSKVLLIIGYSAAGLGSTVAMAFGVHKLRRLMQSGSYLVSSTPSPPGFIELA